VCGGRTRYQWRTKQWRFSIRTALVLAMVAYAVRQAFDIMDSINHPIWKEELQYQENQAFPGAEVCSTDQNTTASVIRKFKPNRLIWQPHAADHYGKSQLNWQPHAGDHHGQLRFIWFNFCFGSSPCAACCTT
jgi:hypothetical protein